MLGKLGTYYAVNGVLTKDQRNVNAEYICRYFVALGWSLQAICGMLGNMQQESNINPGRWQGGIVKDSKGYGLVQWTPSTKFLLWAKANGLDELMDGQLARIKWEHDTGAQFFKTPDYPMTFKQFALSDRAAYYLGRAFGRNYERSGAILSGGEAAEKSLNARGEAAKAWYAYFAEKPTESKPNYGTVEAGSAAAQVDKPAETEGEIVESASKIISYARAQLGKPYKLGTSGPDRFDCSGLTKRAAQQIGLDWYHGATTQWLRGSQSGKATQYGYWKASGTIDTMPENEICFLFNRSKTNKAKMAHVAIYDPEKKSVIQAGGYLGKGVHENPFRDCRRYFTHWAILRENTQESPQEPQGSTFPTLRNGSEGEEVKALQNLLNQHGAALEVDGKFGRLTEEAVREFQDNNHLEEDGIAGPDTWKALTA